ncbi:MAG: BlaI/MecI/CopY family transcriptional regulator [Longimicrobiales bacterium]
MAGKAPDVTFTGRELDVMAVLWERGQATVAQVRQSLADELAYTTVLTVLRTLEEKGHVGHEERGRAYVYHPLVARETAGRVALRRLVNKVFGDSPELLLTQLVSDRSLSDAQLERMRRMLERSGPNREKSESESKPASESEFASEPEAEPDPSGPTPQPPTSSL